MLLQTCLDNIDWTIFLCNTVPACIGYFSHKSCLFAMGQHWTSDFLVQFDPERSGQHCRLFSSAKLFVDCAMIGGEMIDPLAASREIVFLIFKDFFVWKQRFGVCLLLILHKQIYLYIIKWLISISTIFLRNQSVLNISEELFEKNIS